jgi:hypothetical protein
MNSAKQTKQQWYLPPDACHKEKDAMSPFYCLRTVFPLRSRVPAFWKTTDYGSSLIIIRVFLTNNTSTILVPKNAKNPAVWQSYRKQVGQNERVFIVQKSHVHIVYPENYCMCTLWTFFKQMGKGFSTCQSFLTRKITEPNVIRPVWLRYQRFTMRIPDFNAIKQAETSTVGRI